MAKADTTPKKPEPTDPILDEISAIESVVEQAQAAIDQARQTLGTDNTQLNLSQQLLDSQKATVKILKNLSKKIK